MRRSLTLTCATAFLIFFVGRLLAGQTATPQPTRSRECEAYLSAPILSAPIALPDCIVFAVPTDSKRFHHRSLEFDASWGATQKNVSLGNLAIIQSPIQVSFGNQPFGNALGYSVSPGVTRTSSGGSQPQSAQESNRQRTPEPNGGEYYSRSILFATDRVPTGLMEPMKFFFG